MTNIAIGYLQSLGADIYHATIHGVSNITAPIVVIVGVILGVTLIAYDVISHRKTRPDIKEIADDVSRQQEKDELDQIDRQNSEGSENDDRYTPANIK
jgi:hypothetical protein